MNKVCSNIEQKGVAQLLQIEEVRLKSSRRCGFSQSPHAQEATQQKIPPLLHNCITCNTVMLYT